MEAHFESGRKILIADDQIEQFLIVENFLRGWGFQLLRSKSGIETIELLEKLKPDLLILDILMPKLSGIEVLQHMRVADIKVPTIVMSRASIDVGDYSNFSKWIFCQMQKPLQRDLLVCSVAAALGNAAHII